MILVKAKGLDRNALLFRNALIPLITILGSI